MPDEQREGLQEELIDIILLVLKRNPQLHYYQGYHDIVVTFLLVLGERLATALVEKLSTHHLRYLPYTLCNLLHSIPPPAFSVFLSPFSCPHIRIKHIIYLLSSLPHLLQQWSLE